MPSMLRMNFISLPVTNSADGGRRSYPKLSKCNKTASFRPIPRWGERLRPLVSQPPPSGNAAPSSGCSLAPPLHRSPMKIFALDFRQIDYKGLYRKIGQSQRGSLRGYVAYFYLSSCDPLYISRTVEARNFKFGTQIEQEGF